MTGIRLCKWCVANTVTISNPSGARKPAKDRSTGRIRRPCGCGYGLWIGSYDATQKADRLCLKAASSFGGIG